MKPSFGRRYRRRTKPAQAEGAFFKKESLHEQPFFGETAQSAFFQPAAANAVNAGAQAVQRKCADCEKEDKNVQRATDKKEEDKKLMRAEDKKEEDKKLMRAEDPKKEEDKKLQKKEAGAAGSSTGQSVSGYIGSLNGKGQALPPAANRFFSSRIGYDFTNVKIHNDKAAAESAKSVNAKAYTIGNHIVFNEGQYDTTSQNGKRLLAHELAHVVQQDDNTLQKKDDDASDCTDASVDLEAETIPTYKKGAGKVEKEKTTKATDCEGCDDSCVNKTGVLKVPFTVTSQIKLPAVPGDLTPCQKKRVAAGINGPLLTHEKQHVAAFDTFAGTASLPVNFNGCEAEYAAYLTGLADQEYQQRKDAADAKSAALDPFNINVDLCCKDTPKK